MHAWRQTLERYFEFEALGANWKTEILAGVTTFMTMAYIVFVNPAILAETGMPLTAVVAATCLASAFGSLMMGIVARYPIALAPGIAMCLTVIGINLLGDGLREQLDPHMRGRRR